MFYNCSSLTYLDFPSAFMNPPQDMSYLFAYCTSLKDLDLFFIHYKDFNSPSSMKGAFRNCTSLTSIKLRFLHAHEDMSYLFMGCKSLVSVYSNFDRGYKYLNHMLHDCILFDIGLQVFIIFLQELMQWM